jgi:AraC-like DNA-binding protein
VASSLNLSTRTLHRRLSEEGWNFRDLCNSTKRELAEAYLRDSTLTLSEVGWLLGYSEHSAFTRAFKQWTGVAPRFWKEKAGGR